MTTLIRGGTVVTASDTFQADLLVEDGVITALGTGLIASSEAEEVNAEGQWVLPGAVDVHTHLELPAGGTVSSDDWESGTRAAAFGGTTTLVDFVTPRRGQPLTEALAERRALADGRTVIDYGLHMSVLEVGDHTLEQMEEVLAAGIPSFKVYTDYPGTLMVDDADLLRVLRWAAARPALVLVHAVNGLAAKVLVEEAARAGKLAPLDHGLSRPPLLEGEATARVLALAELADAPLYLVHLSCIEALQAVRQARLRGRPVHVETCPHYLYLSLDRLAAPKFEGAKYVCNPPLREHHHAETLWQGLASGEIQTVATDHCPFRMADQKTLGRGDFRKIPNGLPGIETRLPLMLQGVALGRIGLNRAVEVMATAPARLLGLYPAKGTLAVGSDADLVLWDPRGETDLSHNHLHMNVDYSLYEGHKVAGQITRVLCRGETVVSGGQWVGGGRRGRFLPRALG